MWTAWFFLVKNLCIFFFFILVVHIVILNFLKYVLKKYTFKQINEKQANFTEQAPRPVQSISCNVHLSYCLSVCSTTNYVSPCGLETSSQRVYIPQIEKLWDPFLEGMGNIFGWKFVWDLASVLPLPAFRWGFWSHISLWRMQFSGLDTNTNMFGSIKIWRVQK